MSSCLSQLCAVFCTVYKFTASNLKVPGPLHTKGGMSHGTLWRNHHQGCPIPSKIWCRIHTTGSLIRG